MIDDPNHWDLYDSHISFHAATVAIDQAWEEAKRLIPEAPSSERAKAAWNHVYAVLKQWADVGALDTEPRATLNEKIKQHFGVYIS